jgi:hypothetical protein
VLRERVEHAHVLRVPGELLGHLRRREHLWADFMNQLRI